MLIDRFELQGTLFNLEWEPIVKMNHYHVGADIILQRDMKDEDVIFKTTIEYKSKITFFVG